jgi:hypothetical protein
LYQVISGPSKDEQNAEDAEDAEDLDMLCCGKVFESKKSQSNFNLGAF